MPCSFGWIGYSGELAPQKQRRRPQKRMHQRQKQRLLLHQRRPRQLQQ